MWLLSVCCLLPLQVACGQVGGQIGWSIIRASVILGEASLPLTTTLGDTGHGQGDGWCCWPSSGHLPSDTKTLAHKGWPVGYLESKQLGSGSVLKIVSETH